MIQKHFCSSAESLKTDTFIIERILNNSPDLKAVYMLGRFALDPTDSKAIVIFKRQEFKDEQMFDIFQKRVYKYNRKVKGRKAFFREQYFHNNEFRKFYVDLPESLNTLQCDLIYPASDTLIAKYTK